MTKVPGAKAQPKVDKMLGAEYGIGSNGESAAPTFSSDHQLTGGTEQSQQQMEASNPAPEAHDPAFVDPEEFKAARDRDETPLQRLDGGPGSGRDPLAPWAGKTTND